ncbi:MAG: BON domain-containing protein [Actinomycetota bacterium]
MNQEPPRYLAGRIEQLLAEDERTAELGIRVTVAGDRVYLRGEVASEARRERVAEVVQEHCPGQEVVNEVSVTGARPVPPAPGQTEVLP